MILHQDLFFSMAVGLLIKSSPPRTNPSSGSQNLENLNTEFQPRLPSANVSFGLLLGHKPKEAVNRQDTPARGKTPTVRAMLLIVKLSPVQF